MSGVFYFLYIWAASKTLVSVLEGMWRAKGPTLDAIRLISLTFANVPLAIISSFPLLDPYELKSFYYIPLSVRYFAAGDVLAMFPAGLIWSVVIESPKNAKHRAPLIF